ncbi:hypothetical protein ACE4RU_07760 [Actinobacillus seminis]|uniref:hypothetical protein n=1 Tax=Actinobacillus seminis TaxID=722 RepID=UPI003B95AF2B
MCQCKCKKLNSDKAEPRFKVSGKWQATLAPVVPVLPVSGFAGQAGGLPVDERQHGKVDAAGKAVQPKHEVPLDVLQADYYKKSLGAKGSRLGLEVLQSDLEAIKAVHLRLVERHLYSSKLPFELFKLSADYINEFEKLIQTVDQKMNK